MKEKFKYNKEIRKIEKHRHLPKYLVSAKTKKHIMKVSKYRKMKNQEINNEAGKTECRSFFFNINFLVFKIPKPERAAKIADIQE